MQNDYMSKCMGKFSFANIDKAIDVAKRQNRLKNAKSSVYLCVYCGGYHVGNNFKKSNNFVGKNLSRNNL